MADGLLWVRRRRFGDRVGRVAETVIRKARCPVLVIPLDYRQQLASR